MTVTEEACDSRSIPIKITFNKPATMKFKEENIPLIHVFLAVVYKNGEISTAKRVGKIFQIPFTKIEKVFLEGSDVCEIDLENNEYEIQLYIGLLMPMWETRKMGRLSMDMELGEKDISDWDLIPCRPQLKSELKEKNPDLFSNGEFDGLPENISDCIILAEKEPTSTQRDEAKEIYSLKSQVEKTFEKKSYTISSFSDFFKNFNLDVNEDETWFIDQMMIGYKLASRINVKDLDLDKLKEEYKEQQEAAGSIQYQSTQMQ